MLNHEKILEENSDKFYIVLIWGCIFHLYMDFRNVIKMVSKTDSAGFYPAFTMLKELC